MKKVLLWILLLAAVGAKAQTEPEYRLELGGGVGLLTYLGDFNTNLMKLSLS